MHPPTIVKQPNGFYTCTYKNGPPHEGPGAGLEDMFEFFASPLIGNKIEEATEIIKIPPTIESESGEEMW